MSGVSFGGIASGLDTEAIISQLIAVDRAPRIKFELRSIAAQARHDALNDIKTRLTALRTAATALRSAATWGEVQSVASADPTKVAARQLAGAAPGGVQLEVTQLARSAQKTFAFTPQPGASQLTVGAASIDLPADATLDDAVAAINASSTAGVYAVKVADRLVLAAKTTGAATTIVASGAALAEDVGAAKPGLDATFVLDGVPGSSSSNVVTTAVPGLELTLKGLTTGPVAVTVGPPAPDTAAIQEKVKAFVDAYNATVEFVRGKLTEKRVPDASNSTDVKKGVLFGDPALNGLLSHLRSTIGASLAGNPAATDQLADIGISTGDASGAAKFSADAVAGKLTLDVAKLSAALTADPSAVRRLLGGTGGVDGFAQSFESVLDPAAQGGGTLDTAATSAQSEVKRLKDQMARLDDRLARREDRLRAQFTALEQALARSQAQQSRLMASFGGLGGAS